jgi:hypothetical protein
MPDHRGRIHGARAAACRIDVDQDRLDLISPSFRWRRDTRDGLRAVSVDNRLTDQSIPLGQGLEFEVDLDAADGRIWIAGWRGTQDWALKRTLDPVWGENGRFFRCAFNEREKH